MVFTGFKAAGPACCCCKDFYTAEGPAGGAFWYGATGSHPNIRGVIKGNLGAAALGQVNNGPAIDYLNKIIFYYRGGGGFDKFARTNFEFQGLTDLFGPTSGVAGADPVVNSIVAVHQRDELFYGILDEIDSSDPSNIRRVGKIRRARYDGLTDIEVTSDESWNNVSPNHRPAYDSRTDRIIYSARLDDSAPASNQTSYILQVDAEDGADKTLLYSTTDEDIRGIAVATNRRKIIWVEIEDPGPPQIRNIKWMDMDGTNVQTVLQTNQNTTVIDNVTGWLINEQTVRYSHKTNEIYFLLVNAPLGDVGRRITSINPDTSELTFHLSGQGKNWLGNPIFGLGCGHEAVGPDFAF